LQAIFAAFMVTVGVYEGFFRNGMVIAKSAPRGAVKLAVAAAIGCLAALTGTGEGIQRTAGGRDCHSLGDGAGNRRGRHYWRGRQRLARSRSARLFRGLRRSRDLRRDDADYPDPRRRSACVPAIGSARRGCAESTLSCCSSSPLI
jgi:hypothetical protein